MPPEATWVAAYGPYGAFALYFLYKELWPWLRDKVWPQLAAEREQAQVSAAQQTDRLFKAFENNTAAMTGLQVTLGTINDQQRELVGAVRELNEDVAGLYGSLQKPRPSRTRGVSHAH